MVKDITYQRQTHQEENTPLVTILQTSVQKKQSTAVDTRQSPYIVDLAKSSFGGIYYPVPGSQWYLKKISGVWTLMARAPQQNPQLNPSFTPVPGDTYIGSEGIIHVVGSLEIDDGTKQINIGGSGSTAAIAAKLAATSTIFISSRVTADTVNRFQVEADGKHSWGPGNSAVDTNLYRQSVSALKTDSSFVVGGDLSYSGKSHARGFIGANTAITGSTSSTGTEVAVTAGNWGNEPTIAFLDGRLYRVSVRVAMGSAAVGDRAIIRVRKGSATIVGTQLAVWGIGNAAPSTNSYCVTSYIKNASGSTVSTKLSLTLSGVAGGTSFSPSVDQQLIIGIEDIGAHTDHAELASIAFAIT